MIRAALCDPSEVRHLLDAVKSPKTDSAGVVDMEAIIRRGLTCKVLGEGGDVVAAYVLEAVGGVLWVLAFGGRAAFDLSHAAAALIEQQGREFGEIMFRTERRGLVRKAHREGYHIKAKEGPAYIMRKKLA